MFIKVNVPGYSFNRLPAAVQRRQKIPERRTISCQTLRLALNPCRFDGLKGDLDGVVVRRRLHTWCVTIFFDELVPELLRFFTGHIKDDGGCDIDAVGEISGLGLFFGIFVESFDELDIGQRRSTSDRILDSFAPHGHRELDRFAGMGGQVNHAGVIRPGL